MSESQYIGRGEKLVERIISRLYRQSQVLRQVPIVQLVCNEDYTEYNEEFAKHKCDLVVQVEASNGVSQTLVVEVNYKYGEKATGKWCRTFAPDIARAGKIPVTIDDYDCRSLFKEDSKKNHKLTWDDFRDTIDQLEKSEAMLTHRLDGLEITTIKNVRTISWDFQEDKS